MSYQKITICGTAGKSADVKNFNGQDYLIFSLAVSNGRDQNGALRPSTWFDVMYTLKEQTKWLVPLIKSKTKVFCTGKVRSKGYVDKNNQPQASLQVMADVVEVMECSAPAAQAYSSPNYAQDAAHAATRQTYAAPQNVGDSVPF